MGRPSKFTPELIEQVEKLAKLGLTDEELADVLDIATSTLYEWKKNEPQFSEAIKRGKAIADANVADRLYQRAMGFEHDSEEIKVVDGEVERVPIRKIYPPDSVAAIFWLTNRQPGIWKHKKVVDGTLKVEAPFVLEKTYGESNP
jgi:transcriptional regulator with XRE-family HTH domain